MTRPSRVGWVRFPHSPATIFIASLLVAGAIVMPAGTVRAQAVDRTLSRVGPRTLCRMPSGDAVRVPSVPRVVIAGQVEPLMPDCRVPISPRAALVRSLLVPGLGQYELDRRKAAGLFVGTEIGALLMTLKSKIDLDAATSARRDTTIVPVPDVNGMPVIDPKTGLQKTIGKIKDKNLADRVRARRTHLEDWIAGIVFNHLFSGADAWVAANLADFNTNVNVTAVGRGVQIAARVAW